MCGRYTLSAHPDDLEAEFGIGAPLDGYSPRYNIAPTQRVLAIVNDGGPRYVALHWGFVPSWASAERGAQRMINARCETVAHLPAFRAAFRRRRCLIPADGFYEWQRSGPVKIPVRLRLRGGGLFAMAGLWEVRAGEDGSRLESCTIITTAANERVRPIHDRMPAILDRVGRRLWLDPEAPSEDLQALLVPFAADELEAYAVSSLVNSPRNDVPACIVPA
jgi:putative SOS response-associated peptidase YedK